MKVEVGPAGDASFLAMMATFILLQAARRFHSPRCQLVNLITGISICRAILNRLRKAENYAAFAEKDDADVCD